MHDGAVMLTASLINAFDPLGASSVTIIDNDGADAVTGTFAGLASEPPRT